MAMMMAACGDNIAAEPGLTSDECAQAEDCAGGVCINELGTEVSEDPITFDDGYCSNTCDWDENGDDVGCTENEVCLEYAPTGEKYCYVQGCETDYDCRDMSYVCTPLGFFGELKICLPIDATDSSQARESSNESTLMYAPSEVSRL
jgi:hypothetical protein